MLVVQMFGSRNDFIPGTSSSQAKVSSTKQTQQNGSGTNCQDDSVPCSKVADHSNLPEVLGATGNSQNDSVHPQASSFKTILPYLAGLVFLGTVIFTAAAFRFKINKKKARMLIVTAAILAILTAVLLLLFLFAPSL